MEEDDGLDFSTVIASSVHDMKNSLSMLLNTLDEIMAACEPSNCASTSKFSQLQYEGQRVNNNLIQLLTIYKIGNSQCCTNVNEHDIEDFLQECGMQYEALLSPKGITIDVQCENDLVGFFDRELISGVINNVVNNAYRYSKDKIRLVGEMRDGYLVISIEDNGQGYPESMLCDFSSGSSGVSFSSGSTGLGLYFSSLVASAHKNKDKAGYIQCSNDGIDGGGKFSIFMP